VAFNDNPTEPVTKQMLETTKAGTMLIIINDFNWVLFTRLFHDYNTKMKIIEYIISLSMNYPHTGGYLV
jgi:hypothetical protein